MVKEADLNGNGKVDYSGESDDNIHFSHKNMHKNTYVYYCVTVTLLPT